MVSAQEMLVFLIVSIAIMVNIDEHLALCSPLKGAHFLSHYTFSSEN